VYYINEDGNIARDVNKIKHSPKLFTDKTYTKYYQKSDFTKQGTSLIIILLPQKSTFFISCAEFPVSLFHHLRSIYQ
jgi:hypothetical protein